MKKIINIDQRAKNLSKIDIRDLCIGGSDFVVIAGPCAIESREQMIACARCVKEAGLSFLRGGAYKSRTSPYSFQGLEEEGLAILDEAKRLYNLFVVTELIDRAHFELVERCADIIQIGSRNMQNYSLLKILGKTRKPVLLKRGYAATIEEWLLAAEYISSSGNPNVILCERGIRTFEEATRFTLDIGAVAFLKEYTNYPVLVDPSHAIGRRELVIPLAKSAVAAGADGLLVEIHPNPGKALSDGDQSLTLDSFLTMISVLRPLCKLSNKRLV